MASILSTPQQGKFGCMIAVRTVLRCCYMAAIARGGAILFTDKQLPGAATQQPADLGDFEEFLRRYEPEIAGYLHRMVGDEQTVTAIATNTTQNLLQLPKDTPAISATQVSWPWLAYQTQTPAQLHLLNIATRSDIVLRSPPSTLTMSALYLIGTTLFTSWTMYQKGVPGIEIDQLSQADQPGAHWRTLQTLADFNGGITVVNDRLVCMTGYAADSVSNTLLNAAWDRMQQRFVQMNPLSRQSAFLSAPLMASTWVLYETSDNILDLIDTSQLPTR